MQILLCENLSAKVVASNPVFRVRSKHMIEVDVFLLSDQPLLHQLCHLRKSTLYE